MSRSKGFYYQFFAVFGVIVVSRFVFLSFAFLGWAFYELSGGDEFEPPSRTTHSPSVSNRPETQPTPFARNTNIVLASSAAEIPLPPRQKNTGSNAVPTVQRDLSKLLGTPAPSSNTPTALEPSSQKRASAAPAEPQVARDVRIVRSARVNLRGGPGTRYSVLGKLSRGDEVLVLREPGNGWVKLKVAETGRIGWMSASLLRHKRSGF